MNVEFINPFLESVINVLATMARTEATPEKPFLKTNKSAHGDVSGIIGLAGEKARGSLAIIFTESAILHVASQMIGEKVNSVDDSVADCIGEITNIVIGVARKILSEKGHTFDMGIPSTIIGKNHSIVHKTTVPILCIPFKTTAGSFFVEVCFNE